jgi:multidrug transporter EmrE-like cation transporter
MKEKSQVDTARVVVLLSIIFIVISEAIAQTCLKKSHYDHMPILFYVGIIFYGIVCMLLLNCYKNGYNMGRLNLIWSCCSIITIIVVGYLVFEEKIYPHDIAAILFAILAVYFANQ